MGFWFSSGLCPLFLKSGTGLDVLIIKCLIIKFGHEASLRHGTNPSLLLLLFPPKLACGFNGVMK